MGLARANTQAQVRGQRVLDHVRPCPHPHPHPLTHTRTTQTPTPAIQKKTHPLHTPASPQSPPRQPARAPVVADARLPVHRAAGGGDDNMEAPLVAAVLRCDEGREPRWGGAGWEVALAMHWRGRGRGGHRVVPASPSPVRCRFRPVLRLLWLPAKPTAGAMRAALAKPSCVALPWAAAARDTTAGLRGRPGPPAIPKAPTAHPTPPRLVPPHHASLASPRPTTPGPA